MFLCHFILISSKDLSIGSYKGIYRVDCHILLLTVSYRVGQLSAEERLPECLFTTNLIWLVRLPFLEFQHVSVWNDQTMKPQSDLAVCQASFLPWYLRWERDKQKKKKLQQNCHAGGRGPTGTREQRAWITVFSWRIFCSPTWWSSNSKVTPHC